MLTSFLTHKINKYYQQNSRLPNDDKELVNFAKENDLVLELSKFKTFHYYYSSDSTITLDYELRSSDIEGSFNIQINRN